MHQPEQPHWFAVQVETNRERHAAAAIEARQIECFYPNYDEKRSWSDRSKAVKRALFPGYVFVRCRFADRFQVVMIPAVRKLVGVGKLPAPIDEEEVTAIRMAVASGLPRRPVQTPVGGQSIRICRGPLKGSRGVLVSSDGTPTFVVTITLLQRSVSLDVNPRWVEVDESAGLGLEVPRAAESGMRVSI